MKNSSALEHGTLCLMSALTQHLTDAARATLHAQDRDAPRIE